MTSLFFGNPEKSLEQAYQAALKIKSIEDQYYEGGRIPIESSENLGYLPASLRAEVEKNLDILKRKSKEFNSSNSGTSKLGQNHLDKLILIEGVLANYSIEQNPSSGLVKTPKNVSAPTPTEKPSYPSPANTVDVTSLSGKSAKPKSESLTNKKRTALPRSIGKTFTRIKDELDPKAEEEVVSKFRRSRQQTVISVRLIALLIIVPILTQQITKNFFIRPIVDQVRGEDAPVYINSEMEEEIHKELSNYKEELEFQSLIHKTPAFSPEEVEAKMEEKADELAVEFRGKSNNAISNVIADMIAFVAFGLVLLIRRQDISVIKSFLDRIIYGLSDSAKAFIIILTTDIFVGFHSPHGWDVLLESLANHLGIAPNPSGISLFIATVPVVMDTMLKYWLFRYLSQISPSTLATLKDMNE